MVENNYKVMLTLLIPRCSHSDISQAPGLSLLPGLSQHKDM